MKNSTIQCPQCKHEFQANEALNHQLQHLLTKEKEGLQKEYEQKENLLRNHQARLKQEKIELESTINKKLAEKEKELTVQLKEKVKKDYDHEISELQKELGEKQLLVNEAKTKELELTRLQRKFEEQERAYELKLEQQLLNESRKMEDAISQREQQKHEMKFAEKDKQLNDLRKQLEEMKRKAEQGSMQLQGEVQELAIENKLRELFPQDEVREVPKGLHGADTLHFVKDDRGNDCGKILYESKRTKNFSTTWLQKLREDQQRVSADVAVLVTEALPEEIDGFGWQDGILICSFNALSAVATLTRDKLIDLCHLKVAHSNQDTKMALLYNYLTSNDFKMHLEEIIRTFDVLRTQLDKEKRAFMKQWKEREMLLDRVTNNTAGMYGKLRGIAGTAIQEVPELELEGGEQKALPSS